MATRSILKKNKKKSNKDTSDFLENNVSDGRIAKSLKLRCEDCKRSLSLNAYYKDSTTATGTYPICIDCMRKRAIDEETGQLTKEGLVSVLQIVDRPYISAFWDSVKTKDSKPETKLGIYIRTLSGIQSQGKRFKDSDVDWSVPDEDKDAIETKVYDYTWKGLYTKREIEILNKQFEDYKRDFVITDASQEDYTRKICKASLELDECTDGLRNGTITEQRYKLAKDTFDSLSKSAKFAKSEREENGGLGCFGQVFDLVEKNVWVDPYKPEEPDVYDKLIAQLSNIERSF